MSTEHRQEGLAAASAPRLRWWVAALLDLTGLVLFVLLGRRQHHVHAGADELLTTLWPFLAGWFAAAIVFSLYRAPLSWPRAIATWLVGLPLAIWLRVAWTDHVFFWSFTLVGTAFIGLFLLGWRLIARLVPSRRTTGTSPADLAHRP
ncbi:MAG: DUF3054 domain-containing protein [Acidimicrobiia bacterium]